MSYLTRMMTARNPRHRKIAELLLAKRKSRVPAKPEDERERLAREFHQLTGKSADKRWSNSTLLAKVLAAQGAQPAHAEDAD